MFVGMLIYNGSLENSSKYISAATVLKSNNYFQKKKKENLTGGGGGEEEICVILFAVVFSLQQNVNTKYCVPTNITHNLKDVFHPRIVYCQVNILY